MSNFCFGRIAYQIPQTGRARRAEAFRIVRAFCEAQVGVALEFAIPQPFVMCALGEPTPKNIIFCVLDSPLENVAHRLLQNDGFRRLEDEDPFNSGIEDDLRRLQKAVETVLGAECVAGILMYVTEGTTLPDQVIDTHPTDLANVLLKEYSETGETPHVGMMLRR